MQINEIPDNVLLKAQEWMHGSYDATTKAEVKRLMEKEDPTDLIDAFYRDLEFGTAIPLRTMYFIFSFEYPYLR